MASLTLRVITPERIVLDTIAREVKFPGLDGSIGVLPRHAPLVAALDAGDLTWTDESGRREVRLAEEEKGKRRKPSPRNGPRSPAQRSIVQRCAPASATKGGSGPNDMARAYTRSITMAIPWPTPMHIVHRA